MNDTQKKLLADATTPYVDFAKAHPIHAAAAFAVFVLLLVF